MVRGCDDFVVQVGSAVDGSILQEIPIVDHDAARVGDASRASVGVPVEPPEGGAVLKVKVGDRVEGITTSFLSIQIPGTQAHQDWLQSTC